MDPNANTKKIINGNTKYRLSSDNHVHSMMIRSPNWRHYCLIRFQAFWIFSMHFLFILLAVIYPMDWGYLDVGAMKKWEPSTWNKYYLHRTIQRFYDSRRWKWNTTKVIIQYLSSTMPYHLARVFWNEICVHHLLTWQEETWFLFLYKCGCYGRQWNGTAVETRRKRWIIENGYLEKKETKKRAHSPEMGLM